MSVVCISGGFDPIHIGHVDLIQVAAEYGRLVVILNSDDWLKRKKGYAFMPWEHRAKILLAMEGVAEVALVDDDDDSVCEALKRIKPDYFANGGDRKSNNTPEILVCADNNIKMLWDIGGEKQASSSAILERHREVMRPDRSRDNVELADD